MPASIPSLCIAISVCQAILLHIYISVNAHVYIYLQLCIIAIADGFKKHVMPQLGPARDQILEPIQGNPLLQTVFAHWQTICLMSIKVTTICEEV